MMPSIMKTLNIKYIISLHEMSDNQRPDYLDLVFSGSLYLKNKKKYVTAYIYIYKNYYNRFYFSESIKLVNKEEQIERLNNNNFNPKEISMLSKPIHEMFEEAIRYDKNASVKLLKWSPNEIILETTSESNQFLNISEVFYASGWAVKNITKNKDVDIYEVNSLIRGIKIDKGKNLYVMNYKPVENKLGSIVSSISFIFLCLLIILGVKDKQHEQ